MLVFSNSLPTNTSSCPVSSSSSSSSSSPTPIFKYIKTCRTTIELRQIHARTIKTRQIGDPLVAAEILRSAALSDHRDLQYARLFFDQMEEANCFSWNTIIRAFSESDDRALEGIILYHQMLHDESIKPNKYTFPSALKACAQIGGFEEGKQIHGQTIKMGLDSDGFVVSNLVRVYAICGSMEDARRLFCKCSLSPMSEASVVLQNVMLDGYFRQGMVEDAGQAFDDMPHRSVISWNAMVAGYAQNGFFKEAVDIFHKMQKKGMKPNYVTLVSVLPAISRLGEIDLGKWVHMYAEKNNIKVDEVLGSALIGMYAKCGNMEKALQVFEELPKKNAVTWSALIGGFAMHGRAKDAIDYFVRMEREGVAPGDVVFIGVLNACSHAGLVDRGRSYFDRMVSVYGLRPRIEHYGCLVDMLGRAGLLEEAEELVLNMPMKPDGVILKALLGACRIHGNIEIGTRVAKHLVELAPHDSGCYVLLSNLCASLGNWEAVAKVRLVMKELDIRKDPGCSWITVDGIVHEFVVEDDSHPRTEEIYTMLHRTKQVLLNIE